MFKNCQLPLFWHDFEKTPVFCKNGSFFGQKIAPKKNLFYIIASYGWPIESHLFLLLHCGQTIRHLCKIGGSEQFLTRWQRGRGLYMPQSEKKRVTLFAASGMLQRLSAAKKPRHVFFCPWQSLRQQGFVFMSPIFCLRVCHGFGELHL